MCKFFLNIIFYCFIILMIQSCHNITDNFITKYNDLNLSEFRGLVLQYKHDNRNQIIYFTAYEGGQHPPYIITFDKNQRKIVNVDRKLLKKINRSDYFSENEFKRVEKLINLLMDNDIPYIMVKVDNDLNTFYNPFYANEPLALMKINDKEKKLDTIIKSNISFKHYKDNWYIRN